jgi:hypothetical protein
MRTVKHFYKVAVSFIKAVTCKHLETRQASCPFTGYTYTTCTNCMTRIKIEQTNI